MTKKKLTTQLREKVLKQQTFIRKSLHSLASILKFQEYFGRVARTVDIPKEVTSSNYLYGNFNDLEFIAKFILTIERKAITIRQKCIVWFSKILDDREAKRK